MPEEQAPGVRASLKNLKNALGSKVRKINVKNINQKAKNSVKNINQKAKNSFKNIKGKATSAAASVGVRVVELAGTMKSINQNNVAIKERIGEISEHCDTIKDVLRSTMNLKEILKKINSASAKLREWEKSLSKFRDEKDFKKSMFSKLDKDIGALQTTLKTYKEEYAKGYNELSKKLNDLKNIPEQLDKVYNTIEEIVYSTEEEFQRLAAAADAIIEDGSGAT